jgi:3-mercaptopyruvate sulfurtransferase SseA
MRSILSLAVVFALGLLVLTACQDAAKPVANQKAVTNTAAPAPKTDEHGHTDDAPRITLAEAKKDFDSGSAVFIDTRAASTYDQEHIKGAINIPMEAVETRLKEIPADKKIIAYCS